MKKSRTESVDCGERAVRGEEEGEVEGGVGREVEGGEEEGVNSIGC